jgi:hypothetical protein|tara:strand:+ start:3800 stop:4534 length:735 start_codon:yes stop_codon:yes gene_type:complete
MARVSTYIQDDNVLKSDKLLGSDSGGGTRNFSLESISNFYKETNAAGVVAQFVWQYKSTIPNAGQLQAVFSSGSTFANLTNLKVSKLSKGDDVNSKENILSAIVGKDIILVDTSDQDNFGVYSIQSIVVINDSDGSATNNYDITLLYKNKSNGSLVIDNHYALVVFGGGADKNYASGSINTNDNRWSDSADGYVLDITHNLGKYGSPTVKDSANTIVHGKISYNALNTLQLTFNAKFVCEVFVN